MFGRNGLFWSPCSCIKRCAQWSLKPTQWPFSIITELWRRPVVASAKPPVTHEFMITSNTYTNYISPLSLCALFIYTVEFNIASIKWLLKFQVLILLLLLLLLLLPLSRDTKWPIWYATFKLYLPIIFFKDIFYTVSWITRISNILNQSCNIYWIISNSKCE